MSALLKLLPVAALGIVGYVNKDSLAQSLDVITKVQSAATAGIEMQGIADAVAMEYADSATLPLNNFSQFLKENMMEKGGRETRDKSKDMWGTDYRIAARRDKNGFEIKSAGPDKKWESEDDLNFIYSLTGIGGKDAPLTAAPLTDAEKAMAKKSGAASTASRSTPTQGTSTSTPPRTQTPEETRSKVVASQMDRAAKGSDTAQYDLGVRYLTGDGVEKDANIAEYWLKQSAAQGNSQARAKLSRLGQGKP
ncbi:MAG: hypothetical protein FJ386_05950 [Verrucomicrobia bacterium]|nr:hypothetical protein [Verrucomicrobiota bacterium]